MTFPNGQEPEVVLVIYRGGGLQQLADVSIFEFEQAASILAQVAEQQKRQAVIKAPENEAPGQAQEEPQKA